MHVGRKYTFLEYLQWTKRELLGLSLWAFVPTFKERGRKGARLEL